MESDNKFENDTGGMSVDEIIADIDRKTANAATLEENSVGVTPEGENEMSDEQVAVSADEADTAAGHISANDESTVDELSGADEMSDGQEALEEKSAELAEEANVDATAKTEKKPNFFYRLVRGIIPWKGDDTGLVIRKIIFIKNEKTTTKYTYGSMQDKLILLIIYRIKKKRDKTCLIYYR